MLRPIGGLGAGLRGEGQGGGAGQGASMKRKAWIPLECVVSTRCVGQLCREGGGAGQGLLPVAAPAGLPQPARQS